MTDLAERFGTLGGWWERFFRMREHHEERSEEEDDLDHLHCVTRGGVGVEYGAGGVEPNLSEEDGYRQQCIAV